MGNPRRAFIKAVQEELQVKQTLVDATNAYNQARAAKRDKGLIYYTEQYRKDIYERAKVQGFSAQDLEKMAYYLEPEHWNQDEIFRQVDNQIIDAVDLFFKAEQYLNANIPKKSVCVKIFDAISAFGSHMDKGDERNDN